MIKIGDTILLNDSVHINKRLLCKPIPREDGKKICRELKKMRETLAKANGIESEMIECYAEGKCAGTCPICDKEITMLKHELEKIPAGSRVYPEFAILKSCGLVVQNESVKEPCRLTNLGEQVLINTKSFRKEDDDEPEIDGGIILPDIGSAEILWDDDCRLHREKSNKKRR